MMPCRRCCAVSREKQCSLCNVVLPNSAFRVVRDACLTHGAEVLTSRCRCCEVAVATRYQKLHPTAKREADRRYRQKHLLEGREYARAWRARNPEKVREKARRQYQKPGTRARINAYYRQRYANDPAFRAKLAIKAARRRLVIGAPDTLTPEEWFAILTAFDHCCAYCGRADLPLEQDHIIPLARGGAHTKENVVPACKPCNGSKSDRLVQPRSQRFQAFIHGGGAGGAGSIPVSG